MLAVRLVRLIESHSDVLSQTLLQKFRTDPKCSDLRAIPEEEQVERAHEIYRNLSDWLLNTTEADIQKRYTELGMRRARQEVRFSHFLWAITATRDHIQQFIREEGFADNAMELHGHLELLRLLDLFFDRALYFAAAGYEKVHGQAMAA